MSLRGLTLMTAAMAMSGGFGYNERKKHSYAEYKPAVMPFDFKVNEIPKGHLLETMPVEFVLSGKKFTHPELEFTYSNEKGKIKRANARLKEVFEYLKRTPESNIIEFDQFKIEEITHVHP